MRCSIIDRGTADAQYHMDKDLELLKQASHLKQPILHFYNWLHPSATHGYFINPDKFLNHEGLQKWGIRLARRPTGGGIVFHLTDLAFSVVIPSWHSAYSMNTLDNYGIINQCVAHAVTKFKNELTPILLSSQHTPLDSSCEHFCMAKPTIYDVMVEGKKVGGAAQRRTKEGFLHQGTIALSLPSEEMLSEILKPGTLVLEAMKNNSYSLVGLIQEEQFKKEREKLRLLLAVEFSNTL